MYNHFQSYKSQSTHLLNEPNVLMYAWSKLHKIEKKLNYAVLLLRLGVKHTQLAQLIVPHIQTQSCYNKKSVTCL